MDEPLQEVGMTSMIVRNGLSRLADYVSGDMRLPATAADAFAWVTLAAAKTYRLIDGIFGELVLATAKRTGRMDEWQPTNPPWPSSTS